MSIGATLSEFIALWRHTLLNSSELNDFCLNNYGQPLTLHVGLNEKNPIGRSNSPFCVLIPVSVNPGLSQEEFTWSIDILWGLDDNTFSDFNEIGASEMLGIYRLDEMGNIIRNEIEKFALDHNLIADMVNFELNNSEYFPLHLGTMSIETKISNLIGTSVTLGGVPIPVNIAKLSLEDGDELITEEGENFILAA